MTRPLRLLQIQLGKEGGTERFFVNLAQALGERGVEQHFVVPPNRSWVPTLEAWGTVTRARVHRIPLLSTVQKHWLQARMKAWKPDAIMAWRSPATRLIPDLPGVAKITRLGDYPHHLRHFAHNDAIVANTPSVERHCRSLGWTGPIRLISNFPRAITLSPVDRAAHGTPAGAFLVCATGRLEPTKGMDTLIRAVADIPEAHLWIAGTGSQKAALDALVETLGIADRVRFLGWVDEPANVIASADVCCLPSRQEPLGNAVLDGWFAGVPVVATRTEGPEWFATDGSDALLVPVDDAPALAAALRRLQDDKALRTSLAAAAKRTLERRFSAPAVVDSYLSLFAEFSSWRPG